MASELDAVVEHRADEAVDLPVPSRPDGILRGAPALARFIEACRR